MTGLLGFGLALLAFALVLRLVQMRQLRNEGETLRQQLQAWSGEAGAVDEDLEKQLAVALTTLADRLDPEGEAPVDGHEALAIIDDTLQAYRDELARLESRRTKRDRQVQRARTLNQELHSLSAVLAARVADVQARSAMLEADRVLDGPNVTRWQPPGAGG